MSLNTLIMHYKHVYMRSKSCSHNLRCQKFLKLMTTTFSVEGCCHGDLDRIYDVLASIEDTKKIRAEFLICCGDFQAIRTQYV